MLKNKFLHLVIKPLEDIASIFINNDSVNENSTVVLIGDGIYSKNIGVKNIYVLQGHPEERGIDTNFGRITYEELVKKIFEYDRVYLW